MTIFLKPSYYQRDVLDLSEFKSKNKFPWNELIEFLKRHPEITTINLSHLPVNKAKLPALIDCLSKMGTVKSVAWVNGKIGNDEFKLITRLHLNSLNLAQNTIDERAFTDFWQTNQSTNLDLSRNNIAAQGMNGIEHHPPFYSLNLDDNPLSDEGIKFLSHAKIQCLSLQRTKISDLGAITLARNSDIGSLDLRCNAIGELGLKAFASHAAKPFISIIHSNAKLQSIYYEGDPIKNANFSREAGIKQAVPSLKEMALFKVKKIKKDAPKFGKKVLTGDLLDELNTDEGKPRKKPRKDKSI